MNKHGAIILNDDNDEARRMVEQCYRTRKTMVNPIVDWSEDEVWEFLNTYNIPHCSLYDEGFTRLGCIGCPLAGSKNMRRDFERWPKYREMYVRAFQKMIDNHPGEIRIFERKAEEERAELGGGGYRLQGVAGFSVVTEGSVMKAQTGDFNDAKTENPSTETGLIWEPVEPDGERLMKRHEWINGVLSGDETPPNHTRVRQGTPGQEQSRQPCSEIRGSDQPLVSSSLNGTSTISTAEMALEHYIWQNGDMNTPPEYLESKASGKQRLEGWIWQNGEQETLLPNVIYIDGTPQEDRNRRALDRMKQEYGITLKLL